ncbi:MAG: hypothetical protein E7341_01325 [Clostridiales bacterium]|nr:hypothetical protein [Clostridiales bacterium]
MNKNKIQKQLIDILLKKANGFYYYEEQEEYEKTQNKSKFRENSIQNISMFDNFVTGQTQNKESNVTLKSSNGKEENEAQTLTLVKKKITKHYIPPDMLAIKILFEINKEKVNENDLNEMSDEELIKLKDKLLGELLNEN